MLKSPKSAFIPIFLLVLLNMPAQVDSVRFNTGDYVLGEIKNMQRGILQVETDYSDSDFKIEWKKTTEIYSVSQFMINLSNGDKYFGTLKSIGDSIIQIITDENEIIKVENKDIVYLNAYDDKFLDRFSASIARTWWRMSVHLVR